MADGEDDFDPNNLDPNDQQQDQDDQQQDAGIDDQQQDQQDDDAGGPDDQGDDQQIDARSSQQQQDNQRAPSRRDRRIDTLVESSRQKDQQIADLTRRIDQFMQQRSQPQGETPEQRNARLATLTPEERLTETLNYDRQQHRQEMQLLASQVTDGNDRAAFDARCTPGSIHAKWKNRVETELTTLRQQGMTAPRDKILAYLLGQAMLDRQGSGENRQQRRQAERRVQSQRTRSNANGSDVRADRGRQTSLERRLENVEI